MKKSASFIPAAIIAIILISLLFSCQKDKDPVLYPVGSFPDTLINLEGLNSSYDDYNIDINQLYGMYYVMFSTNRLSQGAQFDLIQGQISFAFDRTMGYFDLGSGLTSDSFLAKLLNTVNSDRDDFGPYRLFSSIDGYEYMLIASDEGETNLDLRYFMNFPVFNNQLPNIDGPMPVTLLNTAADDAYITFDTDQDSLYFCSDRDGLFDIYLHSKPSRTMALDEWLGSEFQQSEKVTVLNSGANDKCPMLLGDMLVFTSDRPGGEGGYDLYYSLFRNGNWTGPVNFGPKINSAADEYRPFVGSHPDFSNLLLIFSSNRPGGKGNFDLYCRGFDLSEEQ